MGGKEASEQAVRALVDEFFDALEARDFERLVQYLSAEAFSYLSPIDRFDNAHDFVEDITRIGPITKRIERRKLFIDSNEVCAIYNFMTTLDVLATTRIAQWMKVKNGKIVSIEVFFDAHAYASMFEPRS